MINNIEHYTSKSFKLLNGLFLIQIAVFLLPIITLLSGVFALKEIPKGWLSIIVPALLFLSLFFTGNRIRIRSHLLREIVLVLGFVTFLSGFYVFWADEAEYKGLFILVNNMFPFLWFMLTKQIDNVSSVYVLKSFCYGAVVSAICYLSLIQSLILGNSLSRSWAFIGNEVASNRNDISVFYLVAIGAFFCIDLGLPMWLRRVCTCIVTLALLCTFSRSSYLGLLIIIILSIKHMRKINILLVAALVIGLSMSLSYNPVFDRILYTFEAGNINKYDDSTALRVVIWQNALELGLENPVLGIGHGRSPFVNNRSHAEYAKDILYAHNYFLTQFFQLGFLGLVITISMFWHAYKTAVRIVGDYGRFFLNVLAIVLTLSLTGDPLYGWVLPLFLIILAGIVYENNSGEQVAGVAMPQ